MGSSDDVENPFDGGPRASKEEIMLFINKLVEEYKNITNTDLSEIKDRFPFWAYPCRVIIGITKSRVYVFITRDGSPIQTQVEYYDGDNYVRLNHVMDMLEQHQNDVASILNVQTTIADIIRPAKNGQFTDDDSRKEAINLVRIHYKILAKNKEISSNIFSGSETTIYTSPLSLLENHIGSDKIKNKIEEMMQNAKKEIMIAGWIDTLLLNILKIKEKEGISIKIITKKPDGQSPSPVKTAYRELVNIAQVKRNRLAHFRLIISDDKEVLVSSCDLTTHSLSQNYEAGIWTCSPAIVEDAIAFFDKVWQHEDTKNVNEEFR